MKPSIFTQIINGVIPCHKIYEDANTFAFLDIYPLQPGHTLIVPKKQIEFVWDLNADDYQAVMLTTRKIARQLRTVLGVPYVSERIVGIDVPHAHVQLIPFTTSDVLRNQQDMTVEPDHAALAELAARLRLPDEI